MHLAFEYAIRQPCVIYRTIEVCVWWKQNKNDENGSRGPHLQLETSLKSYQEFRCQFHQHSTYSFCACRSRRRKKILMTNFFTLSGSMSVKVVHRTLMKLNLGVNFINIFCALFRTKALFWLEKSCQNVTFI